MCVYNSKRPENWPVYRKKAKKPQFDRILALKKASCLDWFYYYTVLGYIIAVFYEVLQPPGSRDHR